MLKNSKNSMMLLDLDMVHQIKMINCQTLTAIPLYNNINIRRIRTTAIVYEADNLFIDAIKNSARIANRTDNFI